MFGTELDQLESAIDRLQARVMEAAGSDVDRAEAAEALVRVERLRERVDATVGRLIADMDARKLHRRDAVSSMPNWLAERTGQRRSLVGARVHLATKLLSMPETSAAFRTGEITGSHAHVLARALNPRTVEAFARDEAVLVGAAEQLTADQLAQVVEHWLRHADPDGTAPLVENDRFFLSQTLDGRLKGSFDLGGDLAVRVKLAVDEATDQLHRQDKTNREVDPSDPGLDQTRAQRRARALGVLVDRGAGSSENPSARRPMFVLHTTIDTLTKTGDPLDWVTELEAAWSGVLSRRQIEMASCDCWIQQLLIRGEDGQPLAAGRELRVANRAMRRALVARDGAGCAVPGCSAPAHRCDAHHLVHWIAGGLTELHNLVLLCRWHHVRIHDGDLRVTMVDGRPQFTLADGRVVTDPRRPPPRPPGDPPTALAA